LRESQSQEKGAEDGVYAGHVLRRRKRGTGGGNEKELITISAYYLPYFHLPSLFPTLLTVKNADRKIAINVSASRELCSVSLSARAARSM